MKPDTSTSERSIVKGLSFEVVSNLVGLGLAYIVFGNFGGCLAFTGVCFVVKCSCSTNTNASGIKSPGENGSRAGEGGRPCFGGGRPWVGNFIKRACGVAEIETRRQRNTQ